MQGDGVRGLDGAMARAHCAGARREGEEMDSRSIWEAKSTGLGDRLDSGKVTEGEGTSGLLPYDSMHAGTFTELGDRTGKLAFGGGAALANSVLNMLSLRGHRDIQECESAVQRTVQWPGLELRTHLGQGQETA